MTIEIKKYIEGAREARGLAVLLDIFRASNTIISCLASGAKYVIPVGELDEARALKLAHPDHLLFGERGGVTVTGFDHGNSPAEVSAMDLHGKKIILTTSAGSQGIVHATQADEIIIGSFANARAITDYILEKQPATVTLLAMGENGDMPAVEDDLCAEYLQASLAGQAIDFEQLTADILASPGAQRLRSLGQLDDLEFCLQLDTSQIVPKFDKRQGFISI